MSMEDKGNPRVVIQDTDLERTLRYMEVLEEEDDLREGVKNTLITSKGLLADGIQEGRAWGILQTVKVHLPTREVDVDQVRQFCHLVNGAGGMDSLQSHYIVNELLVAKNHSGKT
jgi:hypothetical protein